SSAREASSMRVRGWYLPGRNALTASCASSSSPRVLALPPSNASRPRPSPLCLVTPVAPSCGCRHFEPVAREELAGELQVRDRALRLRVVEQDRLAERRRLGDAHVAGDHRVENLVAVVAFQLVGYLDGERAARIVHRAHQRLDLDARIQ